MNYKKIMKVSCYGAVIALILSLLSVGVRAQLPAAKTRTESKQSSVDTATVIDVLDGDTFVLSNTTRIRLIGVDTPEKGEPFADVARAFADSVLRNRKVRIELDRLREDRYERTLGYLFLDGIFFNELLVRNGLARVYQFKENRRYSKKFINAQKDARKNKVGIWSLAAPPTEPYYISAGGSYRFHRPLCPSAKSINPRKARKYRTRDSALDDGLSPCRQCRP